MIARLGHVLYQLGLALAAIFLLLAIATLAVPMFRFGEVKGENVAFMVFCLVVAFFAWLAGRVLSVHSRRQIAARLGGRRRRHQDRIRPRCRLAV